ASRELLDPELAYLKARYAPLLSEAFAKTIASLPVKQRTVLRMYFVEGLTTDAIARIHRVDGSTVVRWIARARSTILEDACRLVTERLDIPPSELESLFEIVRSQIDMTLERVLA